MNIAMVFSSFSPYHHARALAFSKACAEEGHRLIPTAITRQILSHQWTPQTELDIRILCTKGSDGDVSLLEITRSWIRFLRTHRPGIVVIAGYWPLSIALLSLIARTKGIPAILMTESHAATARDSVVATFAKRMLIKLFPAAMVGGIPHREHLIKQGFDPAFIRDGYDCVDNDYFAGQSEMFRSESSAYRQLFGLPRNYFLSVGRLVAKKNIRTLITAYDNYRNKAVGEAFGLVIVGDGELRTELRQQCSELSLPVRDFSEMKFEPGVVSKSHFEDSFSSAGVSFYGSRKVDEIPVFFSLCDTFVLPSLNEEWGLVVNEAMASSCPVIVSKTAGCALDLLPEISGSVHPLTERPIPGVNQRSTGILFDPADPKELAAALTTLGTTPALRNSIALNAKRVVAQYSPQRFARNLMDLMNLPEIQRLISRL